MGREIKIDTSAIPIPPVASEVLKRCYLCGNAPKKLTKEHVIPKHIFSPNRIQNPLVLRACDECNQNKKIDDEYTAIRLQGTTDSKESREAFDKSLNTAKKALSPIILPKHLRLPGAGLVMELKYSTSDLPFVKQGGFYVEFDGGTVELDVPRLNNSFINMAKGIIVASKDQHYPWKDYEFKVLFDQTDFPQIEHILQKPFQFITRYRQYAEKWEDALFIQGLNHTISTGEQFAMVCFAFFGKFLVVVSMKPKDYKALKI